MSTVDSRQEVPSPPHTPHSSNSNVEPQALSQPDGPSSPHPHPKSTLPAQSQAPQLYQLHHIHHIHQILMLNHRYYRNRMVNSLRNHILLVRLHYIQNVKALHCIGRMLIYQNLYYIHKQQ